MTDKALVVAFDGTPASQHAVREAGALLPGRRALVVAIWQSGLGFELTESPAAPLEMPLAPLDVRTAMEIDQELAASARRLARDGAQLAREAGLDAEGLAVADDPDTSIAETIVRVARERDAAAIVVGAHGYGRLSSVILGSTSRDVIRMAECPVIVVRDHRDGG